MFVIRLLIFFAIGTGAAFAQCPTLDFTIPATACRQENIQPTASVANAASFRWDYCDGSILNTPNKIADLSAPGAREAYDMVAVEENNQQYLLSVNYTTGKLYRYRMNAAMTQLQQADDLTNFGIISRPLGIGVWQESNAYYALIVTEGGLLFRVSFGASIANTPTAVQITGIPGMPDHRHMQIFSDDGKVMALIAGGGNTGLSVLDFGASITNQPTRTTIAVPGAAFVIDLEVIKECGNKYALLVAYGSGIHLLNFGSSYLNTPTFSAPTGLSLSNLLSLTLVKNKGEYSAFITTTPNGLHRIDFGASISNATPAQTNLGTFANMDFALAHASVRIGSQYYDASINYSIGFDGKLTMLAFPKSCSLGSDDNTLSPQNIKYPAAGTYHITLTGVDASNRQVSVTKSVTVGATTAPDLTIQEDGVCLQSPISFHATPSSGSLVSLSWTFGDGDAGSGQDATHQYSSTGDYNINLTAQADNNCYNRQTKAITIYNRPSPAFSLPVVSPFCTNQLYTFNNTSTFDAGYPVTWEWLVNGVSKANTEDFEFTFSQTTAQTVTLKASIPGCEQTHDEVINTLSEGPFVDFTFNGRCEESTVTFTNNSSGVINSFTWNFDDGTPTSAAVDVNHVFAEPGSYDVTLSASTASGCLNSAVETVTIYSKPVISFSVQAPPFSCSRSSTMFVNNTANPTDSNIATWLWDFDDPTSGVNNASTIKTPQHVYASAGAYDVSLTATTNFGCQSVLVSPITIAQTPTATFSNDPTCEDVNVNFRDETGATSSWDWQIGSSFYTVQNPVHQFANPGNYTVSLTVTASNGCLASTSKLVNVPMKISPDFTFIKNCVNENTTFTDVTNDAADAIVQRRWTINGSNLIESDPVTTVTFPNVGVYAASLVTVTQSGCISAPVNKNVSVSNRPQASFTATPESGGAPLTVQFDNNSVGAVSYLWSFNDADNTVTNDVNPEFTFLEEGEYEVQLTATSIQQCAHTFSRMIRAEATLINLVLSRLNLLPTTGGGVRPEVTIVNESNVSLADIELIMDISGESQLRQVITGPLLPGASQVFTFPVEIADRDGIRYVCVTTTRAGESETSDNRICEDAADGRLIIPPYPNPANDLLEIEWISSRAETTTLSLATPLGSEVLSINVPAQAGYSHYTLDVSTVPAGMYVLSVRQGTHLKSFRIVVAH